MNFDVAFSVTALDFSVQDRPWHTASMPEAGDPLTLVPKPQEQPNTHVRWHARTHASACTFTYSLARSLTHSETSFSRSTSLAVLHTHTHSLSLSLSLPGISRIDTSVESSTSCVRLRALWQVLCLGVLWSIFGPES